MVYLYQKGGMQHGSPAFGRDLSLVYQPGASGFPSGGGMAVSLSGIRGPGLILRGDLLHHFGGNGDLQPAK